MILVTGASGNVGRHVVSGLVAEGADVRALTRDPASARWPEGIEVARGDLSVASTLDAVLDGVDVVFLLWHQASAEHPDAAVDALARHAHRVVYVSSLTVDDDLEEQAHPMTVIHADIERSIRESGLAWTFLRAGRFATNSLAWAPEIRAGDVVRLPNAAAVRSPIDPRDVGAVAVRTLLDDGHAGATHILTGPERLTEGTMVHVIGEVIGRTHPRRGGPRRNGEAGAPRRRSLARARRRRADVLVEAHRRTGARHANGSGDHRVRGAHVPSLGDGSRR